METVSLPMASPDDTIAHGLGLLRDSDRSALMIREEGSAWLIRAGTLVQAASTGLRTLRDIQVRRRVHPFGHRHAAGDLVEADHPGATGSRRGAADASVRDASAGTARVQMRRQALARAFLEAPRDCYCTNPKRRDNPHAYSPPLPANGLCKYDRYPIVCA